MFCALKTTFFFKFLCACHMSLQDTLCSFQKQCYKKCTALTLSYKKKVTGLWWCRLLVMVLCGSSSTHGGCLTLITTQRRHWIFQSALILAQIQKGKVTDNKVPNTIMYLCQVSYVMCPMRVSPVTCHLSLMLPTKATDPPPANSPIIHSRLVPKIWGTKNIQNRKKSQKQQKHLEVCNY